MRLIFVLKSVFVFHHKTSKYDVGLNELLCLAVKTVPVKVKQGNLCRTNVLENGDCSYV